MDNPAIKSAQYLNFEYQSIWDKPSTYFWILVMIISASYLIYKIIKKRKDK